MRIDVRVDTKAVNAALAALGREGKAACSRALNRTIVGMKTLAVDMTLAELNLKKEKVNKRITVRRSFGTLDAAITIAAKPSPFLDFKGTTFSQKSRRGVAFKTKRGGQRTRFKHAFILQLNSGPRVFLHDYSKAKRMTGRGRMEYPLKQPTSTLVAQFLGGPRQLGALKQYGVRRFTDEFRSELNFRLRRRTGAL